MDMMLSMLSILFGAEDFAFRINEPAAALCDVYRYSIERDTMLSMLSIFFQELRAVCVTISACWSVWFGGAWCAGVWWVGWLPGGWGRGVLVLFIAPVLAPEQPATGTMRF